MLLVLAINKNTRAVERKLIGYFVFLRFAFFKVLPGDYEILATHPTWALKEVSISFVSIAVPTVLWFGDKHTGSCSGCEMGLWFFWK